MVHNTSIASQQCIVTLELGGVFLLSLLDSNGFVYSPSYLEQKEQNFGVKNQSKNSVILAIQSDHSVI